MQGATRGVSPDSPSIEHPLKKTLPGQKGRRVEMEVDNGEEKNVVKSFGCQT